MQTEHIFQKGATNIMDENNQQPAGVGGMQANPPVILDDKPEIFKLYDSWIENLKPEDHDTLFLVTDEQWNAHFRALSPDLQANIRAYGYSKVHKNGVEYNCMAYKAYPFVKTSEYNAKLSQMVIDPNAPSGQVFILNTDTMEPKPEIPAKIPGHPNLNANGNPAPEGNNYAEKFKTPEERKEFLDAYIAHIKEGFSDDSFSFKGSGIKVFKSYTERYPLEFPTEILDQAQAERMKFWERLGRDGVMGIPATYKDKDGNTHEAKGKFNDKAWIFNMQNRFKWKVQTDVTSDGEKLEGPTIFIPAEVD